MGCRRELGWAGAVLVVGWLAWPAVADTPGKDKLQIPKDAQVVLDLTNAERKKEGLASLKANAVLFEAARAHSANMAKKREMKHELDGKNPSDRVKAAGYPYGWVGENIAYGDNLGPKSVVELWMNSPHHRENILKKEYKEIGIGIVRNQRGEVYYTQVFGTRRGNP